MRQILLQNATLLLQNTTVVTNCGDSYYKMRRLLQIATVQSLMKLSPLSVWCPLNLLLV